MSRLLIVPAAGRGSRLGSDLPKVLYPVEGRPMLDYLLALYLSRVDHVVLVLHPSFEEPVREHCRSRGVDVEIVLQPSPTGMLPAILLPQEIVARRRPDHVWITWCDQIAVRPGTVDRMAQLAEGEERPGLVFPTVVRKEPYIHFDRETSGRIIGVRQRREGSSMPETGEGDSGLFCLSRGAYLRDLLGFAARVRPGAGTGEANFLPFIPWLAGRDTVLTYPVEHESESVGVNTTEDVEKVRAYLRGRN